MCSKTIGLWIQKNVKIAALHNQCNSSSDKGVCQNAHRGFGPAWGLLCSSLKEKPRSLSETWKRKYRFALKKWTSQDITSCDTLRKWPREPRPREVKWLAQSNTDSLWQSWPLNTGLLIPKAVPCLLFKNTSSLMSVCKETSGHLQRNGHSYHSA